MSEKTALSEAERSALEAAKRSTLISKIPERNMKGLYGEIEPGMGVYRKLERRGLLVITDEDPTMLDDGEMFEWTPSVEITDEGLRLLAQLGEDEMAEVVRHMESLTSSR